MWNALEKMVQTLLHVLREPAEDDGLPCYTAGEIGAFLASLMARACSRKPPCVR